MKRMSAKQWPAVVMALAFVLVLWGSVAAEKIRVIATIPDLADITRQIGKDRVSVSSLTLGVRDIHAVQVKPSMVTRLNRADVVVLMGLTLEHSFLPALLDVAANPRISRGGIGYIDTSAGVVPLGMPETLSRRGGDVHPAWAIRTTTWIRSLGKLIARNIAEGLSKAHGEHRRLLHGRTCKAYHGGTGPAHSRVAKAARSLDGVRFVSYHDNLGVLRQTLRHAAVRHPGGGGRHRTDAGAHRPTGGADEGRAGSAGGVRHLSEPVAAARRPRGRARRWCPRRCTWAGIRVSTPTSS